MSCFGGHDEQIYLVEILIDRLTLTPSKIKDIGVHPIVIKIKLLDLPVFEIAREGLDAATRAGQNDGTVRFAIGRCCLFLARPRDLVHGLRSTNPRAGVFRAGDTYPTGETELALPGCLCDQVAMIGNDPDNRPKPFAVKGGYHLLDAGENPSGTLYVELTIACLGRVCTMLHELRPKSLVFGEQDKERELCARRYVSADFLGEKKLEDTVQQHAPEKEAEAAKPKKKGKK